MAFLEEQLDPMITLGALTRKRWNRTLTDTIGGAFKQKFNWSTRLKWMSLEYRPRPLSEYETLADLFDVVLGNQYVGFRAKDWGDYQLTQTNSALSLILGSDWQINRIHKTATAQYLHPIKKPISGTIVIFRTRSSAVSVASASIDYTTGIATISGHVSGDTYTATGEFDIPLTFDSDEWTTNLKVSTRNLWLNPDTVVLRELKNPT
jgi:uncharacterized protein (TIGR02217 family)